MFPSQRALDEGGLASLEEERRLAYVAITRARRKCTILHAANRRIYGQWTSSIPSRFVAELPKAHIDEETTMTGGESLWRANGPSAPTPSPTSAPRSSAPAPRPRLAARARAASSNPRARSASIEVTASAVSLGNQGRDRPRARPARVPRQVRLRHHRRDRRQQARDRLRAGRPQEGARQLRQRGVSSFALISHRCSRTQGMIEVQLNSSNTSMPVRLPRLHTTSPAGMFSPSTNTAM